ncbi:ABC transporter substrate-binding protein [Nocardioides sp. GY 10127]|nr:ABC transporter substrate-binding protein [Nocardioides sp. GY 10127]
MRRRSRVAASLGVIALATTLLAACGSESSEDTAAETAAAGATDLAAAGCPATIVIQTDWNPEAEHGHLYEMFGDDATIDADNKSVSGTLYDNGESTGVKLEVRAGGPAIGYSTVSAQMYTDKSITMGYVTTDDQIASSATTPTKSFFAPLDLSPLMVMWDPTYYPDVTGIDDLKDALDSSGGVWRYFAGSAYMDYLESAGYVSKDSMDSSYDGTPANFVAAGGKDVQQGFASAEPYQYENEVKAWGKKVDYALISDTGWDPYQSSLAVRSADFDDLSDCLAALTPVLQRAEVNYFADPTDANNLVLEAVQEYNTGWTYSQGMADYSVETMLGDKLVSNGDNDYIGDFDDDRMSAFFDKATKTYSALGTDMASGLKVSDLYTNEFIDDSIGLSN